MLLSAAIIVRDEAEHLDACLRSLVGLTDEIVVVDTGSRDDSIAVARSHGAILAQEPWTADFSRPRNRALDLATGDWILYIDADERVRPGDFASVRSDLGATADHVAFRVRFVPRVGWTPYREYRLWRNRPEIRFVGAMHETTLPAIERAAQKDGLRIGDLDTLTIDHLGYEGNQSAKHDRDEPMLRAALAENPHRVYLYDHLARIHEDRGDDALARATWRDGLEVARSRPWPHPDDRLLWTNLLVHAVARGDPDGDVAALADDARARDPDNPVVEFATAIHELADGDPASAAERLERLIATDVERVIDTGSAYDARIFGEWAWDALGLCRLALDDPVSAAEAFARAEADAPDNAAYRTRRRLAEGRAGVPS
jgi:glycosyltransferase involved in cell wall biosynthesis